MIAVRLVAAGVPFLAAAVLATTSGRLVRALRPATAVRLLTLLALTTALGCGYVLAVTAFWALGQLPQVAALGHWSAPVLRRSEVLPPAAGAALAVLVLGLLGASAWRAARQVRQLGRAESTCRRLGPGTDGLVVIDSSEPDAYTLSGLSSRVVVTTAMLRALAPVERRALLAHEASHRRHRHHAYNQLSDLAAAANPLLRPAARAVRRGVERWADEDAATHLGDRRTTARAVARAALARAAAPHRPAAAPPPARRATITAAVGHDVPERARALLAPPPPRRPLGTALLLLLAVAVAAGAGATGHAVERQFEHAEQLRTHPAPPGDERPSGHRHVAL